LSESRLNIKEDAGGMRRCRDTRRRRE